ncbi:MAG: hypothetical protein OXI60_02515 [Acidiferrobacterales bacterium]|nr:hypothetical protein [Acidiferrobacterales bacterium]
MKLNACGQRLGKGNRLAWHYRRPAGPSSALCTGEPAEINFPAAEGAAPLQTETLSQAVFRCGRSIDCTSGVETLETYNDTGLNRHLHTGIETRDTSCQTFSIHPDQPNSAVGTCTWWKRCARQGWRADVEASVEVRAGESIWTIGATLKASDADGVVAEKP